MNATIFIKDHADALRYAADEIESARHENDFEKIFERFCDAKEVAEDGIYYAKLAIQEQEEYAKSVS